MCTANDGTDRDVDAADPVATTAVGDDGGDTFSSVHPRDRTSNPTTQAYADWRAAYDYFNERLFGGCLPNCLITLTRRSQTLGYFLGDAFESIDGWLANELAMNPAHLQRRGDREALSTLAHEQCHVWRHVHGPRNKSGRPGTPGYHDLVWAWKMEEIGLLPTNNGKPDGKRTGYRVTHLIIDGGTFDLACRDLLASGFTIHWHDRPLDWPNLTDDPKAGPRPGKTSTRQGKRSRFTCPDCELKAWAKESARLVCGECGLPMFRSG